MRLAAASRLVPHFQERTLQRPLRGHAEFLLPVFLVYVLHFVHILFRQARLDIAVTGNQFVYQPSVDGALPVPDLAGCHRLDIQLLPVGTDKFLEQHVRVFEFFLQPGTVLVGVLPEHGQGALVLAGGELLEVDIGALEQAMKVGNLGQHADRANHRKGRG